MRYVTPALQFAGIILVAIGAGLYSLPIGIVLGGIGLFVVGFVLDQRPPR
jgi:hypothetical protein